MTTSIDIAGLIRLQDASYAAARGIVSSWPRDSAMDATELESFLRERHYCVLATTGREGRPSARPVAYAVHGTAVWWATVAGARLSNLRRTPWASLVIEAGDAGDHRAVAVDGRVVVAEEPPDSLAEAWVARFGSEPHWAVAWCELRPRRLFSYAAR